MTESNNNPPIDNQNEKIIISLRYEISSLKSQLKKKDDWISSPDGMLNQIMESHNAEVRAYEDLKDQLENVIEMLRKRIPHGDILEDLKVKDRVNYGDEYSGMLLSVLRKLDLIGTVNNT